MGVTKIMTYGGIQNWQERVSHVKQKNIPEGRARFVQCRDALMQILVRLDSNKNSNVSMARAFVVSEKRLTVRLCFAVKISNGACE